jgi:hypothetical protein
MKEPYTKKEKRKRKEKKRKGEKERTTWEITHNRKAKKERSILSGGEVTCMNRVSSQSLYILFFRTVSIQMN